jgi:hypothetical protein
MAPSSALESDSLLLLLVVEFGDDGGWVGAFESNARTASE